MKIPNSERLWVTIIDEQHSVFYITSNKDRSVYYIYSEKDGRLGRGKNPTDLESEFIYKNTGRKNKSKNR